MTKVEAAEYLSMCADGYDGAFDKAVEMAIAALRAQSEAEKNEPLTLEELLELGGDPVYAECISSPSMSCWGYIDDITNDFPEVFVGYFADFPVEDYGEIWLAYRHKPENGGH